MHHPLQPIGSKSQARGAASQGVRRWLALCVLAPFTYAILGCLALLAPQYEVFPFFSWFLFPVTPATVTRWSVQVQELHARPLTPPTWFEETHSLGELRHSMDAQVLIQTLGQAVQHQDAVRVNQIRSTFEHNFLAQPCRYLLLQRTYEPVARWVVPDYTATKPKPMASFECGKP